MNKRNTSLIGFLIFIVVLALLSLVSIIGKQFENKNAEASLNRSPYSILIQTEDICTLALQGDVLWGGGINGVYKIDRKNTRLLEKLKFDADVINVKAVFVDKDGYLWIGYESGVIKYKNGSVIHITTKDGLADNRVNAIFQDSKGRMCFGTWGGLCILDEGKWKTISKKDGLSSDMVNVIMEDSYGYLWLGSYTIPEGAVSILKNDTIMQTFTIKNGLPNNNITSIYAEKKNITWVGTGFYDKGGACKFVYQNNEWKIDSALTKADGLAGEKVRSIFLDSLGHLWFGSEYDGGAIIKNNKSEIITKAKGLSNDELKVFVQDKEGNLWIGTHEGITKIAFEKLKQF